MSDKLTIPCDRIRQGDFLILQGRPCQVIKITTSSTGQYRYLGVDLFTKQLHEETATTTRPNPDVVVQTMIGPIFKQYRVLDLSEDGTVTAITENGEVKPMIQVADHSNLYSRLKGAFESGRGSVRIMVLNDGGRELCVDVKTLRGGSL